MDINIIYVVLPTLTAMQLKAGNSAAPTEGN